MWPIKKKKPSVPKRKRKSFFNSDLAAIDIKQRIAASYDLALANTFQRPIEKVVYAGSGQIAMDASQLQIIKAQYESYYQNIPESTICWYGSQGFIGYQMCAMLAQNWLIDKACTMPAQDAARNGFDISVFEESEVDQKKITDLKELNVRYKINENLIEFIRMGRIFGIRIAMFVVDGINYEAPFNIDGVKPGSYRGISQIDPYWITPELDTRAAADPSYIDFYEPTWWRINGQRIHRSHLVIFRTSELPDILKPTYFYGGIPLPQRIYERVYAAEMTANEAPMLARTKRTTAIHVDIAQAEANPNGFMERINLWAYLRDNYGIKTLDHEDVVEQFDTSLTDLDAVIMTQYQLVAAIGEVPSTKLLGTAPKGFNATGEFDEASYHETLQSMQKNDMTPLVDRHHLLAIKSEISPDNPFKVEVSWNELDVPTAAEQSDINFKKAQTGSVLITNGAIDPVDEHNRLVHDPDSGYTSLTEVGDISELNIPEEDDDKDSSADD